MNQHDTEVALLDAGKRAAALRTQHLEQGGAIVCDPPASLLMGSTPRTAHYLARALDELGYVLTKRP